MITREFAECRLRLESIEKILLEPRLELKPFGSLYIYRRLLLLPLRVSFFKYLFPVFFLDSILAISISFV
jgi:hypothetical protein